MTAARPMRDRVFAAILAIAMVAGGGVVGFLCLLFASFRCNEACASGTAFVSGLALCAAWWELNGS